MKAAVLDHLRKIPQYTRHARHARSVIQHGNIRKWSNLIRVEIERKLRRIEVKGHPYLLIIDPCNYCNLRCPLCPTGVKDLGRKQSIMSFDDFKRYFDPHIPYLFEAYLHNWGESLINKETYRFIQYAQENNVGTNLSSNLVTLSSDDINNILDSGLEYLVASLDGVTAESYKQYRVRGNFDRVVHNISELLRRRNLRKLKTPIIEWQFIIMKHNLHEVAEAERLAKKLGVDLLRFIPAGIPFDFQNKQELIEQMFPPASEETDIPDGARNPLTPIQKPGPCFYLYRSMVINTDGGISPCCEVYRKNSDFADLNDIEIDTGRIWNNEMYRSARAQFSHQNPTSKTATICDGCEIFSRPSNKQVTQRSPLENISVITEEPGSSQPQSPKRRHQ